MLPFARMLLMVCFLIAFALQITSCWPKEIAYKQCYLSELGACLYKQYI